MTSLPLIGAGLVALAVADSGFVYLTASESYASGGLIDTGWFFGYLLILGSLLVRGDVGRALTFMLSLTGLAFSLYLTYLELFVIDAICQWCVASAVVMTALLITATIRLLRPATPDRPAPA